MTFEFEAKLEATPSNLPSNQRDFFEFEAKFEATASSSASSSASEQPNNINDGLKTPNKKGRLF